MTAKYKRFDYAVHNKSGLILQGIVNFHYAITIDTATVRIMQQMAAIAYEFDLPFDPFNVRIAISPKPKPKTKTAVKPQV